MAVLPVFEHDPFLQYRPFPEEASNLFSAHWHEMAASVVFYQIIQWLSPVFAKRYLGSSYTTLPAKTKLNFDIHVVSMVQCIISIAILLPMWNHPNWANRISDPEASIFGTTDYGALVASLTIGYFVWDLLVCLVYFKLFGIGFLFHAFAALYVFACTLVPYAQPWIPGFLLFELSTPFVNINWFASRLPAGTVSDRLILINGLLLLFTFFSVRIVWGFYAVSIVAADMFQVLHLLGYFLPATILALNVLLDSLNIFWFWKMVQIAKKKASGKASSPRQSAKSIDKIE